MTFEDAQKAIAKGQVVQWQDRNGNWNDVDPKTCEITMARDISTKLRIKMEESKMEFDKGKVYTALNADELKPGNKVIVADRLSTLKVYVENNDAAIILDKVEDEEHEYRFKCGDTSWSLAYLVSLPEEKKLRWTDLKVGDLITNGRHTSMVTEIDKECTYNMHIYAGYQWYKDDDLEEWEKVEE